MGTSAVAETGASACASMLKRHPFENRYCNQCHCTTRHQTHIRNFICLRCGTVKYPVRSIRRTPVVPVATSA